ncbi:hypothetical protein H3V53_13940 [Paraburkholderia bengalensis]|uniref:Uncharacterized protein n=1 Tax=Paraburkholderia bengalensis TaxID=2747562 RepID=A0ABU8IRW4_9BURK
MKEQKQVKTPEAIAAEQAEIELLRAELTRLCNKVPQCVLAGSYDRAVAWKKRAIDALRLAESKAPTLAKLRNARDGMARAAEA